MTANVRILYNRLNRNETPINSEDDIGDVFEGVTTYILAFETERPLQRGLAGGEGADDRGRGSSVNNLL
jgi:hypothetical protein